MHSCSYSDDEEELEQYELIRKLDHGRFSVVYEGRHRTTQQLVAIKQIRYGSPATFQREVSVLRQLGEIPHVIQLLDSVSTTDYSYLIFEKLDSNLEQILSKSTTLSLSWIKSCVQRILKALKHCHAKKILHRDVKPNNIMFCQSTQELYLIDFGQARALAQKGSADASADMTTQVMNRNYRPPELLMGEKRYNGSIDIWALGCLFSDLLLKQDDNAAAEPLFSGKTDIDQLAQIAALIGCPDEKTNWPGVTLLPNFIPIQLLEDQERRSLQDVFPQLDSSGMDLLRQMLTLDPKQRITASKALEHSFFTTEPLPCQQNAPSFSSFTRAAKKRKVQIHSPENTTATGAPLPSAPSTTSDKPKGRRIQF